MLQLKFDFNNLKIIQLTFKNFTFNRISAILIHVIKSIYYILCFMFYLI